jgi:hypothetical protein
MWEPFQLAEHSDHWEIALNGRPLGQCCFSHLIYLQVGDHLNTIDIFLRRRFRLILGGQEHVLSVGTQPATDLALLLALLNKRTEVAVARKNGRLELGFSDGGVIVAEPDEYDEAWTIESVDEEFEVGAGRAGEGLRFTRPERSAPECRCQDLIQIDDFGARRYANLHLIRLRDDRLNWRTLYRCPATGKLWKKSWICNRYRDGGPPLFTVKLEQITDQVASTEFETVI